MYVTLLGFSNYFKSSSCVIRFPFGKRILKSNTIVVEKVTNFYSFRYCSHKVSKTFVLRFAVTPVRVFCIYEVTIRLPFRKKAVALQFLITNEKNNFLTKY